MACVEVDPLHWSCYSCRLNRKGGSMKLTLKRDRYQAGSLTTEKRSSGPDVWVYRWREPVGNGRAVQRKRIVGTVDEYKTKSQAQREVDGLRLDINSTVVATQGSHTVA